MTLHFTAPNSYCSYSHCSHSHCSHSNTLISLLSLTLLSFPLLSLALLSFQYSHFTALIHTAPIPCRFLVTVLDIADFDISAIHPTIYPNRPYCEVFTTMRHESYRFHTEQLWNVHAKVSEWWWVSGGEWAVVSEWWWVSGGERVVVSACGECVWWVSGGEWRVECACQRARCRFIEILFLLSHSLSFSLSFCHSLCLILSLRWLSPIFHSIINQTQP